MESITVLDGGFSTQLALVTGNVIDGDPLWSARYLKTNPNAVLQTHLDFLNAGAEIIITNSYQASIPGFVKHLGIDESSGYDLIKESVRIARRAVDTFMSKNPDGRRPKIAGSIGPFGACLNDGSEYTGSYVDTVKMEEILDWHRPRLAALLEEGVDYLAIETMPALVEAVGLLTLVKEYPGTKVWVSFQCKDDAHIAHGEKFKDAVRTCWEANGSQLVAVGCNCVNPKFVQTLLTDAGDIQKPFIVYPNSGEEYSPITGWSGTGPGIDMVDLVGEWLNLGVKYIGGCCRTNSRHVSCIREAVQKWRNANA